MFLFKKFFINLFSNIWIRNQYPIINVISAFLSLIIGFIFFKYFELSIFPAIYSATAFFIISILVIFFSNKLKFFIFLEYYQIILILFNIIPISSYYLSFYFWNIDNSISTYISAFLFVCFIASSLLTINEVKDHLYFNYMKELKYSILTDCNILNNIPFENIEFFIRRQVDRFSLSYINDIFIIINKTIKITLIIDKNDSVTFYLIIDNKIVDNLLLYNYLKNRNINLVQFLNSNQEIELFSIYNYN